MSEYEELKRVLIRRKQWSQAQLGVLSGKILRVPTTELKAEKLRFEGEVRVLTALFKHIDRSESKSSERLL